MAPAEVVFYCPGTPDKPPHPCTPEAVAALDYALDAPTDLIVIGAEAAATKIPPPIRVSYPALLERIGTTALRTQVKCQYCATVSILTDQRIEAPREGEDFGVVDLLPVTPGDEALIDAAKGVSGAEAVKNSTANATFVTGNLTLLTTLVTVLGLSKTEEIGSKLTEGGLGVLLVLAVGSGLLAIGFALWAMLARVREVQLGNLEAVRAALKAEVSDRVSKARYSLFFFMAAVGLIGLAFLLLTAANIAEDDGAATGSLSVSITRAPLQANIESSWTGADDDAVLELSVEGAATEQDVRDVTDGKAELDRSVPLTRPPQGEGERQLTVVSKLVDSDEADVPGALKQVCYTIPASGPPRVRDC